MKTFLSLLLILFSCTSIAYAQGSCGETPYSAWNYSASFPQPDSKRYNPRTVLTELDPHTLNILQHYNEKRAKKGWSTLRLHPELSAAAKHRALMLKQDREDEYADGQDRILAFLSKPKHKKRWVRTNEIIIREEDGMSMWRITNSVKKYTHAGIYTVREGAVRWTVITLSTDMEEPGYVYQQPNPDGNRIYTRECNPKTVLGELDETALQMLDSINLLRAERGFQTLKLHPELTAAAKFQALAAMDNAPLTRAACTHEKGCRLCLDGVSLEISGNRARVEQFLSKPFLNYNWRELYSHYLEQYFGFEKKHYKMLRELPAPLAERFTHIGIYVVYKGGERWTVMVITKEMEPLGYAYELARY